MKFIKLVFLLILFTTLCFGQKYTYDNCFIRDNLGKFIPLNQKGNFEIRDDSIYLFEQRLKIHSSHITFNELGIYSGIMYNGTDEFYFYTLFLTVTNELYLYLPDDKMVKFILQPYVKPTE